MARPLLIEGLRESVPMFKFAKNLFYKSCFFLGLATAIGWIAHGETKTVVMEQVSAPLAQMAEAPASPSSEPQEFSYVQPNDGLGSIVAEIKAAAGPAAPALANDEKTPEPPKECKDGKDKDGKECTEVAAGEKKEGTEEAGVPPTLVPEAVLSQYYQNPNDPSLQNPNANTTASNNTASDQKSPDLPLLPDRFPSSSNNNGSSYGGGVGSSPSSGVTAITATEIGVLVATTISSASFSDAPYSVSGQTVYPLRWGTTSGIDNSSAHLSMVKSGASVEVDVQFTIQDTGAATAGTGTGATPTAGAPVNTPVSLKMIPTSAEVKNEMVGNNNEMVVTLLMPNQNVQGQLLTDVKVEMVYQKVGTAYQLISGSGLTFNRANVQTINQDWPTSTLNSQPFVASELSFSMNVSK